MINASKDILSSFFSGNLQFVVPFFQRPYVWDEENWEVLWDHLDNVVTKTQSSENGEHFIGTLITKQREAKTIGEDRRDLIDGQQRLTTVSLLLKAISTKASGQEPYIKLKSLTNSYIVFENAMGGQLLRVEPSQHDKDYFDAVMLDRDMAKLPNQEHRILRCYKYFLSKLKNHTDEQLGTLVTILLNKVPVISMLLSVNDDEQEIFDTINSLGVRLTTGELLKNHIFHDQDIRVLYEDYWESVFEDDEEQMNFWNKPKTSGRIIRTNIEVLLYCYLIIKKKSSVELEKLFSEYKLWLKGKSAEDKREFLKDLKEYAEIYYNFPENTELNEISFTQDEERFFHIIENLGITTVYPLILYIYKRISDQKVRLEMLKVLESYLVRRVVCRYTNKNYNNLFIQMIARLDSSKGVDAVELSELLYGYAEEINRFPSDEEFRAAFLDSALTNAYVNEILFCLSLYHADHPKSDIRKLSAQSYSVEHILPKKWETHWNGHGMTDADKYQRNKKLKTIGNLTLVTKPLNSSMKNASWVNKKALLREYSKLKITTDYLDHEVWDETAIDKRAVDLSNIAIQIWKREALHSASDQ